MSATQDTEITLGTGKVLALFFGLVALCAAFFGIGFKMGKASITPAVTVGGSSPAAVVANPAARPSAVKSDTTAPAAADVAFYKSGGESAITTQAATETPAASTPSTAASGAAAAASPAEAAADPAAPAVNGYYVQVAAVSKQEDGDALVDALKKKQYPASATAGSDKLFHVQVGPFSDIKSAEDMRAKLVADGYNPILKK